MTNFKTIKSVTRALKTNVISPKDVLDQSIKVVENIKSLNAFTYLNTQAPQKDYDDRRLSCIPFAVKDNFCTNGIQTTCASKALKDFIPSYSATVVERLLKESAFLLGKCNLDEFAMGSGTVDSIFGPTKNVWGSTLRPGNEKSTANAMGERIAGGSSGGCAVAVSSGACYAALGSDTGGSVRNPASYCGVVGYKPTYGTVSRHGLIPLVNSMDVPGILTRSVEDAALIFNIISGQDPLDSTTVENVDEINLEKPFSLKSIRVGVPREYHCKGMSPSVLAIWDKVASLLEEGGAKVMQVSMPYTAYSIACYSILNQCEVASNMARFDGLEYGLRADEARSTHQMFAATRSIGLNQVVRGRILAGNYFLLKRNYQKYFEKALKVRRLISDDFKKAWDQVDVLLTPTTLGEAPLYEDFRKMDNREQCSFQDYCTQPANMAGCPAISIPIQLSEGGFPLSLQLMAPNFNDETLLQVAKWVENAVQFPYFHGAP